MTKFGELTLITHGVTDYSLSKLAIKRSTFSGLSATQAPGEGSLRRIRFSCHVLTLRLYIIHAPKI